MYTKKMILCVISCLFIITGCNNINKTIEKKLDEHNLKIFFKFRDYGNTYDKDGNCFYENLKFTEHSCYRELPYEDNLKIYILNINKPDKVVNVTFDNNEFNYDNVETLKSLIKSANIEKEDFDNYLEYYEKQYIESKYIQIEGEYKNKKLNNNEIIAEIEKSGHTISKDEYNNTYIMSKSFSNLSSKFYSSKDNYSLLYKSYIYPDIVLYYLSDTRQFGIEMEDNTIICTYNILDKQSDSNNCDDETIIKINATKIMYNVDLNSMHITEDELMKILKEYN